MIMGPREGVTAAALMVVGTRGHSALPGILVGSVAQRLVHLAHQPVLAVPPPA
jgi:nucleotide-binding universal stress UspA family protein